MAMTPDDLLDLLIDYSSTIERKMGYLPNDQKAKLIDIFTNMLMNDKETKEDVEVSADKLRNFVNSTKVTTVVDLATAIIYFFCEKMGREFVELEEVKDAFFDIRRSPPSSLMATLRDLSSIKYDNRIVFRLGKASIASNGIDFIKSKIEPPEKS